ncbi:hypothetical protein EBU99_03770 [bacterium]|nr:hypothetical protein [bacterium]
MKKNVVLILGLASSVAVLSCGKKKSSSAEEVVSDAINNALAIGYPDGLSIPTFPKSTSASSLNLAGMNLDETGSIGENLKQKRDDAKKIMEGGVDDCFQNLKARAKRALPSGETCYEFDQEMIYGWRDQSGNLKGTTSGLSSKSGSTEVCMVSFARDEMKEIEAMIDQALDRAQVMACQAKKAGKPAPTNVGDTVDLKDELNAKAPKDGNAPTFNAVTLKRIDDKDGKPVFETLISTTKGSQTDEVTILHSPASTGDNTSYNGVIRIKRTGDANAPANASGKTHVVSLEYARSSEGGVQKIKASVRRARFDPSYTTLFDDNGRVNFADLQDNAGNSTVDGIGLVEFDMNQTDTTGTLSYWRNPGGNLNEAARGFVFKIEKDSSGVLKGCSVSGAVKDTSIRKALKESTELKPNGWYHPFFYIGNGETSNPLTGFDYGFQSGRIGNWKKPGLADATLAVTYVTQQTGTSVTRQCFKQDANGNYAIDTGAGIGGTAGYELIAITDSKFIAPPALAAIKGKKLK